MKMFSNRATDWNPILKTIRINRTLTLMAFRSYYQQTLDDQGLFVVIINSIYRLCSLMNSVVLVLMLIWIYDFS